MLSRREQSAFTLIEVIVAMVILSIILIAASMFIVNGFTGSNKSINERRAIQQAGRTMSSLERTIKSAKSPDRDETIVSDTASLSAALLHGAPLTGKRSSSATASQVTLDVRDILYADSARLILRTDALPEPGVECVEYEVRTTGDRRTLLRHVWYGTAPGAAPRACRIPPATTPAPDVTETMISTVGNDAGEGE